MRAHIVCGLDVLREHAELVAAKPREHVAWAQLCLEPARNRLQESVAGDVAVRVVDRLEAVKVDEQDRIAGRWRAARLRNRALNELAEERPVREIRQRIVLRLPARASRGCGAAR